MLQISSTANISGISLKRLLLSLAFIACAGGLLIKVAVAGTPSSGTLSPTNTTIVYTGGPFATNNPSSATGDTPPVCTTLTPCDQFALKVASADAATQKVTLSVAWTNAVGGATDYDVYVYKPDGTTQIARASSSNNPESLAFAAVNGDYNIIVVPYDVQPTVKFTATVALTAGAVPVANPTPAPPIGAPSFSNYIPPSGLGADAGEPSIGVNWKTGNAMFQASLQTLRVTFNDCTSPARALWVNKPGPNTSTTTLDPILFTDHDTGRTFVSQLAGKDSLTSFTDNDGDTYTPSEGGSAGTSGVDHQTFGGGPFAPGAAGAVTAYKNAVYYASQDIADANLATSRDGGLTFGPAVPMYTIGQCGGLHGHVKVAPDGTVYVPNKGCNDTTGLTTRTNQAVVVSTDNGTTFTVRRVPTSKPGGSDPSVGVALNKPAGQISNTIYFGYVNSDGHPRIAVSRDRGVTWTDDQDVGTLYGTVNTVFPAVVAGDDNRASFAYHGTSAPGPSTGQDPSAFSGEWHLYVATTYDGGKTWLTTDATPADPVQRSVICTAGTTCASGTRNLLDFMDVAIDKVGRVLVGYADGCIGACAQGGKNSGTALATIARQSGGRTLFAANDPGAPQAPASPVVTAGITNGTQVHLSWDAPFDNGSPIIGYNVYRGAEGGTESLLAALPASARSYDDNTSAATNFYYVTAVNAVGESLRCDKVFPKTIVIETSCTLPGRTVTGDPTGDQLGAPNNKDLDIQTIYVAEPYFPDGSSKLVFTMKVADLSTIPPDRQYRILWTPSKPPSATEDRYYVGMNSNTGGASAVTFEYGTVTSNGNVPTTKGAADAGSVSADGTIRIIVSNSKVGAPKAGDTLATMSGRNFAGNGLVSLTKTSATDATGDSSYALVGNASCLVTPTIPPATLLNISTRANVQVDDRVSIGGLIITGQVPKKVVIRGIGPSLTKDGGAFPGRLADPTLELYSGQTKIAENDNWKDSQEQEIRATNLAPTDDRESAIVRTLDPGLYTAIMRGKNGSQGIGVVEVYDGDRAVDPKLANLSTRAVAGTGDDVMIGGFIAGTSSTGNATVAIRGLGPSLNGSGLSGTLQDPILELRDANGAITDQNDDWMQSKNAADIQKFGLAPADGRESVILGTMAPGNYTAIIRGKDGSVGLALIEIYSL